MTVEDNLPAIPSRYLQFGGKIVQNTRATINRSFEAIARSHALLERLRLKEEGKSKKACPEALAR